jgi:hypothetical protein
MEAKLTFEEFSEKLENDILKNKPDFMRKGQTLMNFLAEVWFEEYKRISSLYYYDRTDIDCFYNDKLIPNTLKHLEEIWK